MTLPNILEDDHVEFRQVWRPRPGGIIPAGGCRVVGVIAPCHIVVGAPAIILIGGKVEHARRIGILSDLFDQALVHQRLTGCPDWGSGACTTNGPPLSIEVDSQGEGSRGNVGYLASTV